MNKEEILKHLERIEINARNVINDVAMLREELSGGSGSSNLEALSMSQKNQILIRRRKNIEK